MRYAYIIAVLLLIVQQAHSQTNQELFDWAGNNFRQNTSEVLQKIQSRKREIKDKYWYAKFDAFIAMIETRAGDVTTAHARYNQSLSILRSIESNDTKLIYQILRNIAQINVNSENYEGAITAFEDALELAPHVGEKKDVIDNARYYLAKSMLNVESRYNDGADLMKSLYKDKSSQVSLLASNYLGINMQKIGNHNEAIEYFHYVVNNDSDNDMAGHPYHNLANSYLSMGDSSLAERSFISALQKTTSKQSRLLVMMDLGKMYLHQGRNDEAIRVLVSATEDNWGFSGDQMYIKVYDYLSEAYMNAGDTEASMEAMNQYRSLRDEKDRSLADIKKTEAIRSLEFQAESMRLMENINKERVVLAKQRAVFACMFLIALFILGWTYFKITSARRKSDEMKRNLMMELDRIDKSS